MKEFTGFCDLINQPIDEGDVLMNSFVSDLWIVEKRNDAYCACLIPNSGLIGHPEGSEYPMHIEDLECVAGVFKKIGNVYDNPELIPSGGRNG